ncbi:MAG: hypothetical protein WC719_02850 [Patescibacteria group bacterium]|jgi:hypothetical protein
MIFGKKKEKPVDAPEPENLPSSQDIIVHNMPSPSRLSGSFPDSQKPAAGSFGLEAVPQKQNFKAVGFLIIGGGVIFIGVLIYLSYYFIISPTAGNNQVAQTTVSEQKKTATTAPTAVIPSSVPTTTPVIIATSTSMEIATSTSATSTLMNEELSGQDGSNLPPLLDSDSDGLIDDEEALLGTSATSTDSDGDKYSDFAELAQGYDPASSKKIADNPNLAVYSNQTFNYSIIYPKSWEEKSLAEDATVVFMASEDSLIQISVQDNPDKAGILGWYESSFPGTTATYDQLLSGSGWDGIMGTDNLNFYLTDSAHKNIYVISYIPAVAGRLVYPNIFKLMINSLIIK